MYFAPLDNTALESPSEDLCRPYEWDKTKESTKERMPCFVIIASDGLWDVMDNDEAVLLTVEVLQRHQEGGDNGMIRFEDGGAFQEAAERLVHEAFVRGSTDNIGVCVAAIN